MTKPLWVVQSNLGSRATLEEFASALEALELPLRAVAVVPFSDELPEVAWDGPVIFYGATGFVTRARASGRWAPCAFFDEDRFRYSCWHRTYGAHLLNAGALETTLGAFAAMSHDPEALFFVRPDRDLKAFAGEVVRFGEFASWVERISAGGFLLGPDEPIVVAEPMHIEEEWRLFLVEGRVSSASRYRVRFRLSLSAEVPAEVIAFGEARAAEWAPAPVFVLDVARTGDGELRVIEVNCFNSAGFYAADLRRVIEDVSRYVEREYANGRLVAGEGPPLL